MATLDAVDLHRGRKARPVEVELPEQGMDGVAVLGVPVKSRVHNALRTLRAALPLSQAA